MKSEIDFVSDIQSHCIAQRDPFTMNGETDSQRKLCTISDIEKGFRASHNEERNRYSPSRGSGQDPS